MRFFLKLVILSQIAQMSLISVSQSLAAPQSLPRSQITLPTWGTPSSTAESRFQPVTGTRGMIVADDRIAAEWGAEILRKGGNAVDAAVATAFAMSVTRPHYASLGGGGFFLYCPKPAQPQSRISPSQTTSLTTPFTSPPCYSIDFREKAPLRIRQDLYMKNGKADTRLSQTGALASGVPGIPAGLILALEKFGSFSRQKILSRPIQLAKQGFRLSTHTETAAIERWSEMNPAAKQIFGCRTTRNSPLAPCPTGTWIKQADLGKVLDEISRKGSKGFYQGEVARKIVQGIQAAGGILSLEDLKSYHPEFRVPLKLKLAKEFTQTGFPDGASTSSPTGPTPSSMEVITMPPPSSGGIVLIQSLIYAQLAAQSGQLSHGTLSVESIHALGTAMGLAFADRAEYLGDPDFVQIPLQRLLDLAYLKERWKNFSPHRSTQISASTLETQKQLEISQPARSEPVETTHFSVIDREGNAVAVTLTVNANFGSAFVPPGTGIVMNDQIDDFSLQSGTPNFFGLVGNEANSIAPGKRPLSSMTPTLIRDSQGQVRLVIGAAGGPRIPTSVFLSLVNRLYFGMSLPDAVFAPRFHQQWKPTPLVLESGGFGEAGGFNLELRNSLIKKGYELNYLPKLGKVHALERFPNQRVWGVADPRGEGAAVPE